ncbi:hypothetical protein C0993_000068 [Termitomyces sp. T159_Od127]|nr:hypothetical protein C0993_000068 [Termitomyces sp. T159_Od127]
MSSVVSLSRPSILLFYKPTSFHSVSTSINRYGWGFMTRSYQSDVVDDSEPEREELRVQERYERQRSVKDHIQYQNVEGSLVVVDLPDDNSTTGQGPASVSVELVNIPSSHGTPSVRDAHSMDTIESITEEDEPKISLARFAYSGTMAKKNASIISTGLFRQAPVASSIADSQRPVKKSTHRFAAHFSDSELNKVAKCVSCDVRWTARKSVIQKMLHIQSCAKKKGLTDETVQVLLRKEIESFVADNESHKGKEIGKCVDPQIQTLFEGVLAETAPKKKARRKEAIETVQTISGTRDTILERARAIIAPKSSSSKEDDESPLQTQVLGASGSHCNNIIPPLTQAFGKSALPQARQTTRKLFDYDVEFSDTEECFDGTPCNSPTFAPSRLGCRLNIGRSLNSSENHLSVRRLPSVDVANDSLRERVLNAGTKIPRERFSGSPPFNKPMSSPERDNNGDSFILCNRDMSIIDSLDHDNAFLHFAPEIDRLPGMPLSQTIRRKAESNFHKAPLSKIRSQTLTESKMATKLSPSIKTKESRVKAVTRTRGPLDDETVESLELKFQDKISQDTDLHLRILRYEPIHFDVFLKLMLGDSFSSASDKARLRMRSLLDKQAIHFYGSEKKRRRRR